MKLGEKLQQLRKKEGLSQEQLASFIAVSRQSVSKWELGESVPDVEKIILLSDIFHVSTDYLLKEEVVTIQSKVTKQENENSETAQILFIGSVAFLVIGLLCSLGGWFSEKSLYVIWGGMLIQVVGIAAYFIGKVLRKVNTPKGIILSNLAIGTFMPISMITNVIFKQEIAPYPSGIKSISCFIILYSITILTSSLVLKRKH